MHVHLFQGDLYVPLEFDTEWEEAESLPGDSDDDSVSAYDESFNNRNNYISGTIKGTKQAATVLKKSFDFDSGLVTLLGQNLILNLYLKLIFIFILLLGILPLHFFISIFIF